MPRKIVDLLSDDEKSAIAILAAGGFVSLSGVKIADCRDLASGNRYRTFRNRGKYDIVIACRNLAGRTIPAPDANTDPVPETPPVELKPVKEMLKEDLLAEARTYPDITGEHSMNKPELADAVQAQRDRRALIHRSFKV